MPLPLPILTPKLGRRALSIGANSANSLTLPLLNVLVPFLVIRLRGLDVWGEFVQVMVGVQLVSHLLSWGNKEYLLRAFSLTPARIGAEWRTSLATRALLLIPAGLLALALGLPGDRLVWILLWGLALFVYQAYDVLIVYRKDFVFALIIELVGLVALLAFIARLRDRLIVDQLIALFALIYLGKALALLIRFRTVTFSPSPLSGRGGQGGAGQLFALSYFRLALPFFLLGLSGMLQSRVDLYTVNALLPRVEIAQYQVFMNLLIYLQSVSVFVLLPFVKSLYRLGQAASVRLSWRLFWLGLTLLLPSLFVIQLILAHVYHITLSLPFFIAGGLLALPTYAYLPTIYQLYKYNSTRVVLGVNGLGILINLGLSLALLPRLGMLGGVVAGATAQWAMWLAYLVGNRWFKEGKAVALPKLS